jgi:hypothetical protein
MKTITLARVVLASQVPALRAAYEANDEERKKTAEARGLEAPAPTAPIQWHAWDQDTAQGDPRALCGVAFTTDPSATTQPTDEPICPICLMRIASLKIHGAVTVREGRGRDRPLDTQKPTEGEPTS